VGKTAQRKVQQRSDLSLEALDNKVHELEKKAADLEPISAKLKDYKKQHPDFITFTVEYQLI